jgi:hypothetical protein
MDSSKPLAKVEDHVYEDIDPKMEWEKNDGFDTLLVHLPGEISSYLEMFYNSSHLLLSTIICLL